ncbi:hypothetical protein [Methylobacterium haplocladii]|uniref:Uncharacterized protein n=1 Tax=Methylobacterium haplocladii TaxID=1176176 RepID=A0A512ILQ2_9HYPH|nr:hypothetical protein [Methylobacterium haplocladii]GEO98637.1 hypothetical protein MHA02_10250 [Methylobacterium haplocladii]GJD83962.1 hypothetical protein HPGCJGGD_1837 [Methylobacterium haplocladii]GLS59468.1 hypothetical protein GCM10007887_21370 [Methylobacterium haplocladii]
MRLFLITCLVLTCTGASAESPPGPRTIVACDNLVTLRRLMAQDPEGDTIPAEFGGCRAIPPDGIGDVEKRAMIGDAPYECRTLKDGPCLWVRP